MSKKSKKKLKLPKGWKMTTLGKILSEVQIANTLEIMQQTVDDIERTKLLRAYYESVRADLNGNDPGFLAYAVPYWINEMAKARAQETAARQQEETEDIVNAWMNERRN